MLSEITSVMNARTCGWKGSEKCVALNCGVNVRVTNHNGYSVISVPCFHFSIPSFKSPNPMKKRIWDADNDDDVYGRNNLKVGVFTMKKN